MSDAPNFPNLLVVIGASAGGVKPLQRIITQLPRSFQGIVIIATHRDPAVTKNDLADIFRQNTRLTVREPVEGESLHCTTLYIGNPSQSVLVEGRTAHIDEVTGHMERLQRIDELFRSAARNAGPNAVGVILSGTLWDGVAGLQAIHEAGGKCIVQDPRDATYKDMPEKALDQVDVDYVGTADEIASILMELAAGRNCN